MGEISLNHTIYMHEIIRHLKAYQKITMKYHVAVTIIIALRLTVQSMLTLKTAGTPTGLVKNENSKTHLQVK